MSEALFTQLVNLLSVAALGAAILLIVIPSLGSQVRMFGLQSVVMTLLAGLVAIFAHHLDLLGVAAALLIVKGLVIPRVLNRAVTNIGIDLAVAPYVGTPGALIVCGGLIVIAFYVMTPIVASNPFPTADSIPLALAGVLIGLFITVIRRRVLTQILGFLILENSIFQLALLTTYGVPSIVEIGVFLDLFIAVLIMEVFIYRIKDTFDTLNVSEMETLKG